MEVEKDPSIPSELVYDILAYVVADYIDYAITTPPTEDRARLGTLENFWGELEDDLSAPLTDWLSVDMDRFEEYYGGPDDAEETKERHCLLWETREAIEPLARHSDIITLLTVSQFFSKMTLNILEHAIGTPQIGRWAIFVVVECRSPSSRASVLRFIRRIYRIAHFPTHPIYQKWDTIIGGEFPFPVKPLLQTYVNVATMSYHMSSILQDRSTLLALTSVLPVYFTQLGDIPHHALRARVWHRMSYYLTMLDVRESSLLGAGARIDIL